MQQNVQLKFQNVTFAEVVFTSNPQDQGMRREGRERAYIAVHKTDFQKTNMKTNRQPVRTTLWLEIELRNPSSV